MSDEKRVKVGRLAIRQEGKFWNAYYALPDSMEGATLLGSIALRFVIGNEDRKNAFMSLMRESVGDVVEEQAGIRPTWPDGPQPAPEHERAGHS